MNKTTCPARHLKALKAFMTDFPSCQVRDVKLAEDNHVPCYRPDDRRKCKRFYQLRTKKHDHLAVNWDELGNAFVLTKNGVRLNLIGGVEI